MAHNWLRDALIVLLAGCTRSDITPIAADADRPTSFVDLQDKTVSLAETASAIGREEAGVPESHSGRLHDLTSPVAELLRQLPGVVEVDVFPADGFPSHRIVHLKDWHFVTREAFGIDRRDQSETELSEAELDGQYEKFLGDVEQVQLEQMALLRYLIEHHALRQIYCEGLADEDVPILRAQVSALKKSHEQLSELQKQYGETEELITEFEQNGGVGTPGYVDAIQLKQLLSENLDRYQMSLLQIRAPGRLLLAGEIDEVLPLEDAGAFAAANPVTGDRRIIFAPERMKARQEGQVRRLLDHGTFSLVVLGGGHDLSDDLKRLSSGKAEYIVVTTKRYQEIVGR